MLEVHVKPEQVVSHLDMFSCTLHCLVYLLWVLTGSVDCLFNLGLVGVITLVLVYDTQLTTAPLHIIQKLYGALSVTRHYGIEWVSECVSLILLSIPDELAISLSHSGGWWPNSWTKTSSMLNVWQVINSTLTEIIKSKINSVINLLVHLCAS